MSFTSHQRVRFGDCDGAGIAYYPRLMALVDAALEDWAEAVLGIGREETHLRLRRGTPTVELHVDFHRPCRLGEMLAMRVSVEHLGGSSLKLQVDAAVTGERKFVATVTQACMDLDALKAVPWPDDWRDRIGEAP